MQTIYTPWACLLSMEQLYYYSGGGRGCQGVGGNFSGSLRGIGGAGAGSRRVGAGSWGVRAGGGPQARRCGASPTAGGARRAARRAAACGRSLRVLQILMWGQSSSTGTVLPSVRMTLTRLGRQMACSPSLASQPFLMHTWSGQSLVIKAMR